MPKTPQLVFFPPEFIELNKEVSNHPDLMDKLTQMGTTEWLVRFIRIATWVKIAMDGDYTEEDLRKIAIMCTHRLIEMRTIVVNPGVLH